MTERHNVHAKYQSHDIMHFEPDYKTGLNTEQVKQRIEEGAVNKAVVHASRSVGRIIFENVFTLFNILNIVIAAMIIAVGDYRNLLFMGIVISNTVIGIFQEIKAKRTVDRLTILTEPRITVIREGKEAEIGAEEVVLDDVMLLRAGNQICADGTVLHGEGFEVDESLVTGEADAIMKPDGSELLSGSFVTAGVGYVRVMRVGKENYASRLAIEAKREKRARSELMNSLNRIVKFLTFAVIPIGLLLFYSQYFRGNLPFAKAVTGTAAALIGMIPEGLILLTAIAFAVGVINLGMKKTLVQSMPCIENLARVDVLCLDKTGTITSGSLQFEKLEVIEDNQVQLETALTMLTHAIPDKNQTHEALAKAFVPGQDVWEKSRTVPFSSARKFSGATFAGHGTWVLGAPEFVLGPLYQEIKPRCEDAAKQGYRVMVLAFTDNPFTDEHLPEGVRAKALILLADTIRSEAPSTFEYFRQQGVSIKVISGDNPVTVSTVAARAGLENAERLIDMSHLEGEPDYKSLVEEYTVFGRVTPYQKRELLKALKKNGHTVAMTGDGVNDVLALKEADCSIAMPTGSEAARQIADLVLLDSNFSALTYVVFEGRRVINNIERVATLYLTKMVFACLMAVVFILIARPYPFVPIQLTVANALTIGIPSFFLALEPNKARVQGSFMQKVLIKSVPAGITVVISSLLIQLTGVLLLLSASQVSAISVLSAAFVGFVVLFNVCKPFDTKKIVLFTLMAVGYVLTLFFFGSLIYMPNVFNSLALIYLPHMALALCFMRIIENIIKWIELKIGNRKRIHTH